MAFLSCKQLVTGLFGLFDGFGLLSFVFMCAWNCPRLRLDAFDIKKLSKRTLLSVIFTLTIFQVQTKTLNVLFIGNSYTYVNDVPSMIQHLGMVSISNNSLVI